MRKASCRRTVNSTHLQMSIWSRWTLDPCLGQPTIRECVILKTVYCSSLFNRLFSSSTIENKSSSRFSERAVKVLVCESMMARRLNSAFFAHHVLVSWCLGRTEDPKRSRSIIAIRIDIRVDEKGVNYSKAYHLPRPYSPKRFAPVQPNLIPLFE